MPDVGASGAQYQPDPFRAIAGDYGAVRVAWERENLTALWVPKIFDSGSTTLSFGLFPTSGFVDLANFLAGLPLELRTPYRSVILVQGAAQVGAGVQDPNNPFQPILFLKTQVLKPDGTVLAEHAQSSGVGTPSANLIWSMPVSLGVSAVVEEGIYRITIVAGRQNVVGNLSNIILNAWVFPFQR